MPTCRMVIASLFSLIAVTVPAVGTAEELPRLTDSQRAHNFPQSMVLTSKIALPKDTFQVLGKGIDEVFRRNPTLVYVPTSNLPNGKRGLMLVLHGCGQTNVELWDGGGLEHAASHGLVIAAPSVGNQGWPVNNSCWDYDVSTWWWKRPWFIEPSVTEKVDSLIKLTKFLADDQGSLGLNIDPSHIYVTGLSAGGAFSLLMACRAPELFAGVGAIAGPSMGSDQMQALQPKKDIGYFAGEAEVACERLATNGDMSKLGAFRGQIANISYGDRDRDGTHQGPKFAPEKREDNNRGSYSIASSEWSQITAKALTSIYLEAERLNPVADIPEQEGAKGQAKVLSLPTSGKPRVALVEIANVGHAWPAGGTNDAPSDFIATKGLNYPNYVAQWFIANNLRAQ